MPDSEVLTLTDPYEHQQLIHNAEVKLLVTSPGEYRAEMARIYLPRLQMHRSHDALPRIFHSVLTSKRRIIFFLSDKEQAPMMHSGRELLPDQIMIYAPGTEHYQRSMAPCRWATMSPGLEDFAAAAEAIAGRELNVPQATHSIRPSAQSILRLRGLHAAAGHLAATAPDILTHPEVARAMEHELVGAMIRCLTDDEAAGEKVPGHRRVPVMQRFERVLEERQGQPIYLAQICAAVGVSERTLRLHCQDHLGMSPHRYLWLRRMNLARRALTKADASATTVTAIATDQGFWEFGRFSVAYRKLFGETPSATLRRAPDRGQSSQLAAMRAAGTADFA
jgi:AraC-like DNA-binding protein